MPLLCWGAESWWGGGRGWKSQTINHWCWGRMKKTKSERERSTYSAPFPIRYQHDRSLKEDIKFEMKWWKINGVKIIYCSSLIPIIIYLSFIPSEDSIVLLIPTQHWFGHSLLPSAKHHKLLSPSITSTEEKTPSAHHHHHLFLIPFVVIVGLPFFSTYKLFIFSLNICSCLHFSQEKGKEKENTQQQQQQQQPNLFW